MSLVDWLSLILAAALALNGVQNAIGVEFARQAFENFGYPRWFLTVVGLAELASAIALLLPSYRPIGLLLAIVCLLGATITLVSHRLWRPAEYPLVLLCFALAIALGS